MCTFGSVVVNVQPLNTRGIESKTFVNPFRLIDWFLCLLGYSFSNIAYVSLEDLVKLLN